MALLLVRAPTVLLADPLRYRGTLAAGLMPLRSRAAPLLTVTPEVLFVPLPKAPATPNCSTPAVTAVAPVLIGLDCEARITRWNHTACDIFGLPPDAVLGREFSQCGISWKHVDMAAEVQRWQHNSTPCKYEDLAFEKDNQLCFVALHVRPVQFTHTGNNGSIIAGSDTTDHKRLEEQLRQSQKLEAIGQLAAGVAHEINTPTQYVGDNTRFLKDSWSDIAPLLSLARVAGEEAKNGGVQARTLAALDAACQSADLNFLLKEVPSAIDQALEGLERVSKIVRAMREFSHPGGQEKRPIDINKAIETTITVARNEWKYVAEVVTQFDPALPLVPCLAGEFNQAILNLIINAAHAIAAAAEPPANKKGTITISTCHKQNCVQIAISDTGTGIPEPIRPRIFEPFFTTKPVGKGTGQGLAMAHSVVVKRHHGRIWFESTVGKGTTFFLEFPLGVEA